MLDLRKNAWLIDLTQTLLRSWWTLVAAICLGLVGATVALNNMTEKYEATTKVWISLPQLPESVARSTVSEDMTRRLIVFRQAMLDRAHMMELIDRTFEMPATDEEMRVLMNTLRTRVTVADLVNVRRQGFATFALTYKGDTDPNRTAKVINTLTDLYINQNTEFRVNRAEKTANHIESQTSALKPELDEIDRRLSEFRQAHRFESVSDLAENHRLLDLSVRELGLLDPRRVVFEAKVANLETQLMAQQMAAPLTTPGPTTPSISVTPKTRELADLQRELDELSVNYSEEHPTYKKKKREFEERLRATDSSGQPGGSGDSVDAGDEDPAIAALEFQIEMAQLEVDNLDIDEKRLKKDVAEYRRRIAATPTAQSQLEELVEQREYLQERYRRLQRQADVADGSVDLEEEQLLGHQMEVLEYASVPRVPYAPDPLRVSALGVILGCLVFVGPLLARNLLNPVILSEEGLSAFAQHKVLVSIPSFTSTRTIVLKRFFKNLALASASIAALVLAKVFWLP